MSYKIEEFREFATKKFADKIETSKNFRFLENKLRSIHERIVKKLERGENWLMAKKPIDFACASCESYIGNLTESTEHVAWSRYPVREEKYRVGEGFSRILNSLERKKEERAKIREELPKLSKKKVEEKVEAKTEREAEEPKMCLVKQSEDSQGET